MVIFNNTEPADDAAVTNPSVMIASDGITGHPRNADTYSRVLARYVRAQHSLTLMEAIRKMSLMPAQRLEASTPQAHNLGRLQEGKTADIVVFDAEKISDRSTYSAPTEPSTGVRYLLASGVLVIDNGAIVPNLHPGRAIRSAASR